jgi:dipeptidyl aminopeptidase/acylaminoacyl peptidase
MPDLLMILITRFAVFFSFSLVGIVGSFSASAAADLRTNLLVYSSPNGTPRPVHSVRDWQKRRQEILRAAQSVMGILPTKRGPLDERIEEETERFSYVVRRITYSSEPGSRVPAYLLIPKGALESHSRLPAVLALHPTDMEFGNRVVVEQLRDHYRTYADELAQRGFVVLAPAYPLMAGYEPNLKALGYRSGTMKAIWDNIRGLDLLETLPFVKPGKFGAIGHSLGGHNAIFTAVFDTRIKVIVSSCGFDSFFDYKGGHIQGWTSERYMPALMAYKEQLDDLPFDFPELIGALAPRRLFVSAPLADDNFNWRSVDKVVRAAWPIYKLYHVPQNLEVEHPDCGHDFPAEVRYDAYRALEEVLR